MCPRPCSLPIAANRGEPGRAGRAPSGTGSGSACSRHPEPEEHPPMHEITVEHNPSPAKLDVLYVEEWPIWEKEASTFDWNYDQKEMCYVLD
ncbi:MAG: cupin domain-containing protein, partial [Gammaproteobacteria bacterium]